MDVTPDRLSALLRYRGMPRWRSSSFSPGERRRRERLLRYLHNDQPGVRRRPRDRLPSALARGGNGAARAKPGARCGLPDRGGYRGARGGEALPEGGRRSTVTLRRLRPAPWLLRDDLDQQPNLPAGVSGSRPEPRAPRAREVYLRQRPPGKHGDSQHPHLPNPERARIAGGDGVLDGAGQRRDRAPP